MDNYVMFNEESRRAEIIALSKLLGFEQVFFKGNNFEILTASSKKELLRKAQQMKQRKLIVFFQPATEEMLRFALEKAPIDGVMRVEEIHSTDSVHYVRSGLDQILCRIACERDKAVVFSFSAVLNSPQRAKLLGRMMFNLELCQKYGVKVLLSNFSEAMEEMRSAADLQALERVLKER